jgi:hypothetical protein
MLSPGLRQSKATINQALRALSTPTSAASSSSSLPPLPQGLPDTLLALLQHLRQTTTSLSLAFKPPISVAPALAQLSKIDDHLGRLVACVLSTGTPTTSILVDEWREGVINLGEEVIRLLSILEGPTSAGDEPYLTHTGLVWNAIDKFSSGLSRTEIQAVMRRWAAQSGVLKDAWDEFKEVLEDAEEEGDGDGIDSGDGTSAFDDDNEMMGDLRDIFSGGKKMSQEERSRAQAVNVAFN